MNIYLVSGSHGFLGSHIIKKIRDNGDAVTPIARDQLYSPKLLMDLVEYTRPTHIIHCASYGNMAYQQNEKQILEANIILTHNILSVLQHMPYVVFIYISSSSVYGPKSTAMHEKDDLKGDTYYAISKIASELVIKSQEIHHQARVIRVRPFSVYGPGEADFRFIPTVMHNLRHNAKVCVAPGAHDWIYIDDFVDGISTIINNSDILMGKAVNIGSGKSYQNKEVVAMALQFAKHTTSTIEHIDPIRSFDSPMWKANNSRLRSLGWKPKYALNDGLKKCWEYYK